MKIFFMDRNGKIPKGKADIEINDLLEGEKEKRYENQQLMDSNRNKIGEVDVTVKCFYAGGFEFSDFVLTNDSDEYL